MQVVKWMWFLVTVILARGVSVKLPSSGRNDGGTDKVSFAEQLYALAD